MFTRIALRREALNKLLELSQRGSEPVAPLRVMDTRRRSQ